MLILSAAPIPSAIEMPRMEEDKLAMAQDYAVFATEPSPYYGTSKPRSTTRRARRRIRRIAQEIARESPLS